MTKKSLVLCLLAFTGTMFAQQGSVPKGVPSLNHVFLIMMENHGYGEILNNPYAPFTNSYALSSNLATNYFAVAHPSLTNYLETVGGSNFGVLDDNAPDWHNGSCEPNLATGIPNLESSTNNICPIAGSGTEAATPALDCSNEVSGPPCEMNLDGLMSYPASTTTLGITIADQLASAGKTWKTYQENLPLTGPDTVNYSDGEFTNNSTIPPCPLCNPALTSGDVVQLYAAKHNPFVYFQEVQNGTNPLVSYAQISAFDGAGGLWWDLATGKPPALSYIVPNQCNDQHGRGNSTAFCNFDPSDNGTQGGLNPALIQLGDQAIQKIVNAIHASSVWNKGKNAIVVVWDENDYSVQPINNQVMTIVDTNYGFHKITSNVFYDHFSLLRTLEGGFKLPCLNHACDASTQAMTDLFGD
ncbi:MAG TPA: alkaline phosphatase family protein [Candidatus Dormibacteraeota bacterium]|nr:alkaline phosphatase family protein [Candidatus Dormibacteraeota bacterium]